ncbi:MAG: hypothetical protein JW727_00550 [Candidatus Aenigmarchaeota archaeon]|nr:hypothetical protein [Candidatus Aenigmarchaeota archaeon]
MFEKKQEFWGTGLECRFGGDWQKMATLSRITYNQLVKVLPRIPTYSVIHPELLPGKVGSPSFFLEGYLVPKREESFSDYQERAANNGLTTRDGVVRYIDCAFHTNTRFPALKSRLGKPPMDHFSFQSGIGPDRFELKIEGLGNYALPAGQVASVVMNNAEFDPGVKITYLRPSEMALFC